jgi:hypothetical protein
MLYGIAFAKGDRSAMQQQVARVSGTPAEAGMLAHQSVTAAYAGRVREARNLTTRAIDLARAQGLAESAGLYAAADALWEAAYGNCAAATHSAARSLELSTGRHPVSWNALAVALCGDAALADRLATEMERRYPHDSFFKTLWLPMIQAASSLVRRAPAAAIERLETTARTESGTNAALWPAYLRGLAYLEQDALAQARLEFKKILDHSGVLIPKDFNPAAITLYPLAHLGTARAAARAGDVGASLSSYAALLALWQEADDDAGIVRAARQEYHQLKLARGDTARTAQKP